MPRKQRRSATTPPRVPDPAHYFWISWTTTPPEQNILWCWSRLFPDDPLPDNSFGDDWDADDAGEEDEPKEVSAEDQATYQRGVAQFISERVDPFIAELGFPSPSTLSNGHKAGILRGEIERRTAVAPSGKCFVLTPFQTAIWRALDGKALSADTLGEEVRDRRRLFKPGGLKDLQAAGLVQNKRTVGYFRPDRPPLNAVRPPNDG